MPREVQEWIGKDDNQPPPRRVKVRKFLAAGGRCQICTKLIRPGEIPQYDHIVALINGGKNQESNLQLLCQSCHGAKTKADVAQKSKAYQSYATHIGLKQSKRPMPGSKASPFKKRMSGEVVRR